LSPNQAVATAKTDAERALALERLHNATEVGAAALRLAGREPAN
jgi:hypothetical protein